MTDRGVRWFAWLALALFTCGSLAAPVEAEPREGPADQLTDALALAESEPKKAASVLKKLLPPLSKKDAIDESDKAQVKLYNQAVTAARKLGVKCPATYRSKEVRSSSGAFTFDVPLELGWVENPRRDKADVIWQRADGEKTGLILTTYRIEAKGRVTFKNGETVSASNVKAIVEIRFKYMRESLDVVEKAKPKIRSVAKKLPRALGFEVRGESDDGQKERIRTWHMKSKQNKKWLLYFTAHERGDYGKDGDPEFEFILRSLRETPRK